MSEISAYRSSDIPAVAPSERANTILHRAARDVSVEVADVARLAGLRADWNDLLTRTDSPNVFMDPALIAAAAAAEPDVRYCALLAWKSIAGRQQLVGLWAFAIGRGPRSVLPIRVLSAPRQRHGHLSTPVLDRHCFDEALDAMLDCVEADADLPKTMALDMMSADGPVHDALLRVLARRSSTPCLFEQAQRPKLASGLDGKAYLEQALSSSTRKKLRQHRRRLSEKGALTSAVVSEPQAVRTAMEEFLSLETAGWKGAQGTALLSDESDAAFMRGAVGALADQGCAAIHALYLDGRPVSMQIVVRSGAAAFTWKTTYDEAFQEFSPGTLLLEDYTTALLADKSIAFADSCSYDDSGFMSAWTERIAVADMWIDARRGGSVTFRIASLIQKNYWSLRGAAKHAYHAWQNRRKPRKH